MKVSYSWLKEFVDIKVSPEKLAEKLTMAGLTVASLDEVEGEKVFDIEVASNRPDWLSIAGLAREVAAITGAKLKRSAHSPQTTVDRKTKKLSRGQGIAGSRQFSIHIEDEKDCGVYCGYLITGVTVAPSSAGLQHKLRSLGLRPVNSIVDITNICLLETGQPLHAFDLDKIRDRRIVVRRAKNGEEIVLIDGTQKRLSSQTLVIADSQRPLAVAGIMGGRGTEVSASTKNILLESAFFDPALVRRGARALGVASDSSYRFERGVDRTCVSKAADRAAEMICSLAGGRLIGIKHSGSVKQTPLRKLNFSLKEAADILSLDLKPKDVSCLLERLGFGVKKKALFFEITVPSWRRDVMSKEDITEEIARSYGYDKIPLTTPRIRPFVLKTPRIELMEASAKRILCAMGLKETVTYSLVSGADYQKTLMEPPVDALMLENPLSQDYQALRTTLVPSLLSCASFNVNHGNLDLELFEISHVFKQGQENINACILLCGDRRSTWRTEDRAYALFDIKGMVEALLNECGVRDYACAVDEQRYFEPGTGCRILLGQETVCCFGKVSQAVKKAWSIKCKEDLFVAEVFLEILAAAAVFKRSFSAFSSTPVIMRDISLFVPVSVSYEKIRAVVAETGKGFVKSVSLAEVYEGKEVPMGQRGLTICIEYGCDGKTPTDAEINPLHSRVLATLAQKLSVTLR